MYPGVDLVADVFSLPQYKDGSVTELYCSNILEHASHTRTVAILKEWRRLLCDGGVLKLSVPDFDRAIEIYRNHGLCEWVCNFLWGDQGYEGANHYIAFTEDSLRKALEQAGFTDISRVEQLPGNQDGECSNLRSNIDGKLVCLNLVIVKT